MLAYQIFTDSCSDLSPAKRQQLNIEYLRMNIVVDGKEMPASLDQDIYSFKEFYSWLRSGKKVKTNAVTVEEFLNKFRPHLNEGKDILYIACSSALSGSISVFNLAKDMLIEEFPNAKLIGIDSLAGAATEGLIAYFAGLNQQKGMSIEDNAKWVEENKFKANQFATVDTLKYLKDAGRVTGASAFFGDIIGVKPIFISDRKGNNFVTQKVRGTKASIKALVDGVIDAFEPGEDTNFIWVGQGDALERAEEIKKLLDAHFEGKNVKVEIIDIGPIVGTTCGPGVLATFCFGKEVTRFEGDGISIK